MQDCSQHVTAQASIGAFEETRVTHTRSELNQIIAFTKSNSEVDCALFLVTCLTAPRNTLHGISIVLKAIVIKDDQLC